MNSASVSTLSQKSTQPELLHSKVWTFITGAWYVSRFLHLVYLVFPINVKLFVGGKIRFINFVRSSCSFTRKPPHFDFVMPVRPTGENLALCAMYCCSMRVRRWWMVSAPTWDMAGPGSIPRVEDLHRWDKTPSRWRRRVILYCLVRNHIN
jgi:hypothetical protein